MINKVANNLSLNGNGKKLTIKPFKKVPTLPQNYEELSWSTLSKALNAVYHRIPLENISKEELYHVTFSFTFFSFVKFSLFWKDC